MSLSIMEYEERLERIEFMRNSDEFLDDPDFFNMQYCEAFAEPDAEDEAQEARDPQEPDAYEITTGEQASNTFTTLPKATNSPVVVEEEAANTLAALPEATHSPVVVAEEEDWAASLFGDEQEPFIAEDEDSFPDQNTSLTDQTDSSTAQTASPTFSTPKSNTGLSLELPNEHLIRDVDFEDVLKKLGCQIDECPRVQVEAPTQLPKSRRYFKDFPKYSPQKAQDDIQNPVQQAEQPINDVKQTIHQIEKQVPLVEAVHQAKYTMQQAQPTQQAQLLHMEEYTVRPIDVFQSVNYQAVHVEQAVPDMQSQVSPVTDSNSPGYSELEVMDGVLSHELNEKSYIVPEEQSEHGLAGLFGLTLDQAKSGMRNKKAGVRNTVIEKPQPTATQSLLQYAGIKKSKSPKAKVATSHNQVENEEQKSCLEPTVPLTGQQNINKPGVATPAMINLPPHVTYEQLIMIHKMATLKTKRLWHQAVQEGIRRVQQHNVELMNSQAVSQLSGQQALNASLDHSVQLNPYHLPQRGPQALQVEHTDKNCGYARQPHLGQTADYASSMSGNHAASDNLQQNRAYLTPGRSPMQVNQDFTYNTPQGPCLDSYYSAIEGSQGVSYPSPQITPRPAGQASPYGSPNNASQGVGQQSPNVHHMAAFNTLQQSAQMGVYSEPQHAWLFPQRGQGDQLQASHPQLQQARQAVRYYAPLPAQQPIGHFLQYDPQNQAQVVAQQYRMQRNQIQCQQTQQSGMQQHLTMQSNLNYSAKMAAQANASKPKHGFTVNDFIETRRH